MNFLDTRHAIKGADIFYNYNYKKIGINKKMVRNAGIENGYKFCAAVFAYCVFLVFWDMVINNNTFKLPIGFGQEAFFTVKTFDEEYIKRFPNRWAYLDPVASEWTAYQFIYDYPYKFGRKQKNLYIYGKLRHLFYTYINNGRKYY